MTDDQSASPDPPRLRQWRTNPLNPHEQLISIHPGEGLIEKALREAQERGDLEHLKGKPLDLDDDPDWLVMRVLKGAGFSHPSIERARELAGRQGGAEEKVTNLARRRRAMLERGYSSAQAEDFNAHRTEVLAAYRQALEQVRGETLAYNLTVPDRLQRRLPNVVEAISRAEAEIPALSVVPVPLAPPAPRSRGFRGLRFRRRRE
ncbi:MAG TPA: DnaJ family domain-containing protein [Chloroflexota bacterium]|nr:DnaJ family domain-containing protein [Chloroflexota bacterium]